jgi:hypothetical protein
MKNTRLTSILNSSLIACALTLGSLASTQVASAQSSSNMAEVNIPFTFQTATQTLPAGKYRVVFEANHLIRLQGASVGAFVIAYDAIKNQAPDHSSVVFDHYGDKYYLHEVWTAGDTVGLECTKSRAEKETLRAKNTEAPSTIELALNSVFKH